MSAHTIEANIGIYTQPGTQPSYLAIGEFGVGTNDPVPALTGVPQENTNRIFLEVETTDIIASVDLMYVDVNPIDGSEQNRWFSSWEMTGECNPTTPPLAASCLGLDGGITTQYTGPNPTRARIRAPKSVNGMMVRPSRTIRAIQRTLCGLGYIPQPFVEASLAVTAPVNFATTGHSPTLDSCINTAPVVANGLVAGVYTAPVFEYIFPENAKPGDTVVPNDLWQLPALVSGEGPQSFMGQPPVPVGPLNPTPW
jgi:hypothetical protein